MNITKIKNRSILFNNPTPWGWDINAQLIMGDHYNYVIDTGLGSLNAEPIRDYIKDDPKPIILINTHYHWDHVWGNGTFKDCTIVSHKLCRDMIETNWDEMLEKNKHCVQGDAEMYLPNITFEDELYFSEDKIRLIYTPGHTIDSISVLDEVEKVIHIGDNVGESLDDLLPSLYADKEHFVNTLMKYKELDFDTCVSGHCHVLDKTAIHKMLKLL